MNTSRNKHTPKTTQPASRRANTRTPKAATPAQRHRGCGNPACGCDLVVRLSPAEAAVWRWHRAAKRALAAAERDTSVDIFALLDLKLLVDREAARRLAAVWG